jgi:hypothetical protein
MRNIEMGRWYIHLTSKTRKEQHVVRDLKRFANIITVYNKLELRLTLIIESARCKIPFSMNICYEMRKIILKW